MSSTKKGKIIEEIFALTKRSSETFFDRLSDKSLPYLEKLLKVVKVLK